MVSIKQVVRGVEEKEWNQLEGREGKIRTDGYNSLALTEVVVDEEKIFREIGVMWVPENDIARKILRAIATAIEQGKIISVEKEQS